MSSSPKPQQPPFSEHEPAAGSRSAGPSTSRGPMASRDSQRLIELLGQLRGCTTRDQVLEVAAPAIGRLMAVDACALLALQHDMFAAAWLRQRLPHWPDHIEWTTDRFPLQEFTFLRAAARERGPFQAHRAEDEVAAEVLTFLERLDAAAFLLIPLPLGLPTAGWVLLTDQRRPRMLPEEEVAFGELLAHHAALAIERVELWLNADQREAELEAVLRAGLNLTASLALKDVLDAILKTTMSLIPGSEGAHIFFYEMGRLRFGAALWSGGRKTTAFAEPRQDGLTATVARSGELILVPDMRTHPLYARAPSDWTGSIVGLPLKFRERVVGVMNVANERVNAFSPSDLRILRMLADQAAIAVENARLHELVKAQAETDILTGLHNRRALDRRLDREYQRAVRYQRPFTLVMLDLDQFKQVNDRYGHPEGDQVLNRIAGEIRKVVREADFLARYGGDEFAIVTSEGDAESGRLLAERIQTAIAAHPVALPDGREAVFTLSVGLATCPADAQRVQELLRLADQALYRAKNAGVGRIVSASDLADLTQPAERSHLGKKPGVVRRYQNPFREIRAK